MCFNILVEKGAPYDKDLRIDVSNMAVDIWNFFDPALIVVFCDKHFHVVINSRESIMFVKVKCWLDLVAPDIKYSSGLFLGRAGSTFFG